MPEGQERPGAGAGQRHAPKKSNRARPAHVLTRPRLRSRVLPDMKSLMQITGAPSEKALVAQLSKYKVRRAFSRQFVPGSRRPRADQAHPRPHAGDDQGSGEEEVQRLLGEGVKARARAFKGARRGNSTRRIARACIRTCKLRTAASRVPAVRPARSAGSQSAGVRARRESCAERAPQTASPAPAFRSRPRCQGNLRRRVSRRRVPAVARGGGSGIRVARSLRQLVGSPCDSPLRRRWRWTTHVHPTALKMAVLSWQQFHTKTSFRCVQLRSSVQPRHTTAADLHRRPAAAAHADVFERARNRRRHARAPPAGRGVDCPAQPSGRLVGAMSAPSPPGSKLLGALRETLLDPFKASRPAPRERSHAGQRTLRLRLSFVLFPALCRLVLTRVLVRCAGPAA